MASGGQVMPTRPEHSLDGTKDDTFAIQGKGLVTPRVPDVEISETMSQSDYATPLSSSRPSTSNTFGDPGEPIGTLQIPSDAFGVLESVINMNKTLEHQIEALRMRIDVEEKQHINDKMKTVQLKEKELKQKDGELNELRESVLNRDERIGILVKEKEEQELEITSKMEEIQELHELVQQTEGHADKLTRKVSKLKEEKRYLESDAVYKQQNDEIRKLRHELATVKQRLTSMETELTRAKNIIEQQNRKLSTLELEKGEVNNRFKGELEKASRAMRQEVERMREVMKQQYEEMRNLREQNKEICGDVREIKELLLNKTQEQMFQNQPQRGKINVNNFTGNTAHGTRLAASGQVRASLPNMKVGHTPNPTRSGLPPILRETTKDNKWVPTGTGRKSVNTLSARGKRS